MNETNKKAYRYTVLAMKILEKLLGSKITVEGLDNIPKQPVLFVANHFTRSETFVVPYIIYKYTARPVRCLADSGLFHGILGRFLKSIGALSTKDSKRDLSIIADLISGGYDWMIYPEGNMVKSKEIIDDGKFIDTANGKSRIRTGSAVLALKSELYRSEIINAKKKNKTDLLDYYQKEFAITYSSLLTQLKTHIVPVNITYYPIRPGDNIIKKTIARIFKKMPRQLSEELEIEGNLLLSSNMNISFGKAIDVSGYIKNIHGLIYQIPIIAGETKINLIIKYLKYRLTKQFMGEIYTKTQINLDHLFAAILYFYPLENIKISCFKNLIYLSAGTIRNLKKYRIHPILLEEHIYKILCDEKCEEFDSAIMLAEMLGILTKNTDKQCYIINKNQLNKEYGFNDIRLENTLQVIVNEFFLLEGACNVIKKNVILSEVDIARRSFNYLFNKDLEIFNHDYNLYYNPTLSRPKNIGTPSFLDGVLNQGILLIHGYLSAPKEVEDAAKYFHKLGFKTYCVRLRGHGTVPVNMEDVSWQDWYDSVNRGYAALNTVCSRIFIIGFSTGGLLALLAAVKKSNNLAGVACINPALRINDIRAKMVFGVNIWNNLLEKFKIEKGQLRYVDNNCSENPDINYSRNYLHGVEQLELLINICEYELKNVNCPTLLIQSKHDPIVNPKSATIILDKIQSMNKELIEIESDKHIIIRGKGSEIIFAKIRDFLQKI